METLEQRVQRLVREEVAIVPYDPVWPRMFAEEKQHLLSCLSSELIGRIEHFGSTAVPRLAAKPIVDMLVEVTDLEETKVRIPPVLEAQGYEYAWFIKRDRRTKVRTHHIHMVESHFSGHWDRLFFRDYLRERPDLAEEYAALKVRLAAASTHDRVQYTQGKTDFIVRVTDQASRHYGASQ